MRRLLILLLLLPLACVSGVRPNHATTGATHGVLLAVGGGGTTDAIVARTLELAGGSDARVLLVPQASSLEDAGARLLEFWREHGATDLHLLDLADAERAHAEISAADFIWFGGGDQNRLMSALRDAEVLGAISERWLAGAVVGGTSAGAAVLSATMIVGGDSADLTNVRAGGTELAAGLGLWDAVIVDQHFLARQRFNRLLAAVLDRSDLVGIGIDECTAVVVHPDGNCEVIGEGGVLIVDARRATQRAHEPGTAHSAEGIALAVYRTGDRFFLTRVH